MKQGDYSLRRHPNQSLTYQDLFRDTPLNHVWHAQIRAQIRPNTPNTVFGVGIYYLGSQIWPSGVSLKRSCKMQLRRIDLVSIGPPSQKLWPNLIFGWFLHCNYNEKVKRAGGFCLLVFKFETFCGISIHHLAALVQKELLNLKKKSDTLLMPPYDDHCSIVI